MLDWQSTTEYVIEEKLEGSFQDFSLQTFGFKDEKQYISKLRYYYSFSVKLWEFFAQNKYLGLIITFKTFFKFKHAQQKPMRNVTSKLEKINKNWI